MKVRTGLMGASVGMFVLSTVAAPDAGLFAPTNCVSTAVIIALTALPTDAIGSIALEQYGLSGSRGGGGED